jgi:hypothetical protein
MNAGERSQGRIAAGLTAAAFAWAVFLVVRAASYDGYVADYGVAILAAHAIPAALVAVAWWALRRACTTGSLGGYRLGWLAAIVLLVWSVIAGFSVGFLAHYSALLLICAAAVTPLGAGATGARCGRSA